MRRFTKEEIETVVRQWAGTTSDRSFGFDEGAYVIFPPRSKFVTNFDMTEEQIQAVSVALFAGATMRQACDALQKVLPEGSTFCFYGNWEILRITKAEEVLEDE